MQIVESPGDVTKFLHLQKLNLDELRTQCKTIGLEVTDESKPSLIKMIMKGKHYCLLKNKDSTLFGRARR